MAKTILIIDDDPVVVKYLVALFENNGYDTITAGTGLEGERVLETTMPDLITLDLEMPEEWGSRFYRRISKKDRLKNVPVIVISGMAGRHAIKKAVAYLPKPFDAEKLLGIVKKTIG
jgi:CheY-like chemotaxis protein